jgi:hypothetical protein
MNNQTITYQTSDSLWMYLNNNPIYLVLLLAVVVLTFSSFSLPHLIGFILLAMVAIHFLWAYWGISVTTYYKNFTTSQPEIEVHINEKDDGQLKEQTDEQKQEKIRLKKQVFNVGSNEYTYKDAKAVCGAYDSRLATYSEVEDYYNKGGEYGQYGWTDGQMILFPTQKATWDELQKIPGHEHDRGRPGVNGGYIDNPNMRFSATCFGYKPKITELEQTLLENQPLYPKTVQDKEFDRRVQYWKTRISDILVAPFNGKVWSKLF